MWRILFCTKNNQCIKMKRLKLTLFALLLLTGVKSQITLLGTLVNDSMQPIPGVKMSISGQASTTTDSRGKFRFVLKSGEQGFKPGHQFQYKIHPKAWQIRNPFDGIWQLHDPMLPGMHKTVVILVPKGSKAMWTHAAIEKFIDNMQRMIAQQQRRIDQLSKPTPAEFDQFIAQWGDSHGYTVSEIKLELDKWMEATSESKNEDILARRAFINREFSKSAHHSRRARRMESPDRRKRQTEEINRALSSIYGFQLEYDLEEAALDCSEAEDAISRDLDINIWLQVKASKAGLQNLAGDHRIAKRIYTRVLDSLNNHPEVDSSVLATLYSDLGVTLEYIGEYDSALALYHKAFRIDTTYFGYMHPKIATRKSNIGTVYKILGKHDWAIECFQEALGIDSLHFGNDHFKVALDYNNLGLVYNAVGKTEMARTYYQKALEIDINYFDDRHPSVATDYNNLGSILNSLGDTATGLAHLKKALSIDRENFGERHPNIAIRLNNIGSAYKARGNLSTALTHYQEALNILEGFFGKNHRHVAVSHNNIGAIYHDQGDPLAALESYRKALAIDSVNFGMIHPMIAIRLNNLGAVYRDLGEHKKAIGHYQKALSIDSAYFGENHKKVGIRHSQLANALQSNGEYRSAIYHLSAAIAIKKTAAGDTSRVLGWHYGNLGGAYHALKDLVNAKRYYRLALDMELAFLDPDDPELGINYGTIGMLQYQTQQFGESIDYFKKALACYNNAKPINRNRIRTSSKLLLLSYAMRGKKQKDMNQIESALATWREGLANAHSYSDNEYIPIFYCNIGSCLRAIQQYQSALDTLKLGIQTGLEHPSKNHLVLQRIYFHRACVLATLGNQKEAKRLFKQLKRQALKDGNQRLLEDLKKEGY